MYVFAAAPFTFHYASTLSEGAEYIAAFNQMTFTFHYASTLSRKPSSHSRPLYNDLHSTMLLLYRTAQGLLPASAARIYIPLCFYFIGSRSALPPGWSVNLHSTMLLLYPVHSPLHPLQNLYLHSTMLLLYRDAMTAAVGKIEDLHSTMLLLYQRVF